MLGPGLAAERLGVVVRAVPRRASAARRARRDEDRARSSASTTRTSPTTRKALAEAVRRPLRAVGRAIPTGASASTTASTACPETFVIDRQGVIRYKHIGPVTPRGAREEDPAARARAAEAVKRPSRSCWSRSPRSSRQPNEAKPTESDPVAATRGGAARRTSCAASCARTSRSPTRTPSSRSTCGARSASRSPPAGATTRSSTSWWPRYGDFVLYRPPFKAATLLLWLGPALLVLAGFWALARALRARRQAQAPPLTPEERARAERLLAAKEEP